MAALCLIRELTEAREIVRTARAIVAFSGAGLSAESGISTFRDAGGQGIWDRYDPQKLASAQGFRSDPALVLDWYRERRMRIAAAVPNAGHVALSPASRVVNITQNVDNLLERAGAQEVTHLHGSITRDRCSSRCGFSEEVDLANPLGLRACPRCGQHLRPDVVWFGETLDPMDWEDAEKSCRECDVLVVIGTSGTVFPAAELVGVALARRVPTIVVNSERTGAGRSADIEIVGKASVVLPQLLSGGR